MTRCHWLRLAATAFTACALALAWAIHDLSRTWADSLRLPADDD